MWEDWYRGLLCELIKRWGRDCDVLEEDVDTRTEQVEDVYRKEGAPAFASSASKDEFLGLLDSLENGLSSPDNKLSQSSNGLIQTYISDLRSELAAAA